jgi:hypothetical protein
MLCESRASRGVEYTELYCEAMAFPLVGPDDLVKWLRDLEPYIQLALKGTSKRKKFSPGEDDRIVIVDRAALERRLRP